ncbi:MAG: SDR family NAD(P)-dependent oxidoreductase [Janthinobacterium lividum]
MRLQDKVAIITGAGSGMGAAEAELFAAEGARVVITDINADNARAIADRIGNNAIPLHHDVSDEAGWNDVVETAVARFGHVDILINNAGVPGNSRVQDTDAATMERILRVNLMGSFFGMRAVIAPMRARGGGVIINIASGLAFTSLPGYFPYGVSKWGVRGMTRLGARDLAEYGIRVNTLVPGAIETPILVDSVRQNQKSIVPIGRVGEAREFAEVALFVASNAASYVSGAEIMVDGALLS